MNRAIFNLAHEMTRTSLLHGDCYRTTFAAALPLARKAVELAVAALATIATLETAGRFERAAIMFKARQQIMAAADALRGQVHPGCISRVALTAREFEEGGFALFDESPQEAMEFIIGALWTVGFQASAANGDTDCDGARSAASVAA